MRLIEFLSVSSFPPFTSLFKVFLSFKLAHLVSVSLCLHHLSIISLSPPSRPCRRFQLDTLCAIYQRCIPLSVCAAMLEERPSRFGWNYTLFSSYWFVGPSVGESTAACKCVRVCVCVCVLPVDRASCQVCCWGALLFSSGSSARETQRLVSKTWQHIDRGREERSKLGGEKTGGVLSCVITKNALVVPAFFRQVLFCSLSADFCDLSLLLNPSLSFISTLSRCCFHALTPDTFESVR